MHKVASIFGRKREEKRKYLTVELRLRESADKNLERARRGISIDVLKEIRMSDEKDKGGYPWTPRSRCKNTRPYQKKDRAILSISSQGSQEQKARRSTGRLGKKETIIKNGALATKKDQHGY